MTENEKLSCFDHVVVLMMENRSFDNILGYLSTKPVDGVIGKKLSNPAPTRSDGKPVDGAELGPVFVTPGTVMDNPKPDPGEYFPHVNTQLYNTVSPPENAFQGSYKKMKAPYNQPVEGNPPSTTCTQLPYPAPMSGFVQDYYNNYIATSLFKEEPNRDEYSVIMNCFPSDKVPVMTGLASNFAVFDQWHCAVPSQTFCNRSFFHAATSNGQVVNAPFDKWLKYDAKTIFSELIVQKKSWVIYYDKADIISLTLLIHFRDLWQYFIQGDKYFRHMDRFHEDVANGDLPNYAFVEPRLLFNHNDQHPPVKILGIFPQRSTVTAGEHLINEVYNSIRTSNTQGHGKSNSENTLLTITYDEHGGCYDHVSPPQCIESPDGKIGQMGFPFDRLGIRVSTIMISAYIDEHCVMNQLMHHTSMLKTLGKKWGFGPLSNRDRYAPDFLDVFTRTTPRPGSEWPVFTPLELDPEPEDAHLHPLNDLQNAIVATVHELDKEKDSNPLKEEMKVGEALEYIDKVINQLLKDGL